MSTSERKNLISQLEKKLNTKIIAIVTGDRQRMETRIAPDLLPLVSEHLSEIGACDSLSLFIYTPGGDSIAGWGLVNLLRQYCKEFKVLVPFRALSCGTLICLGADELVMGKRGILSPVDPSVSSPFNPVAPGNPVPGSVQLLPVSVEDMIGFLDLARKEIGLKTEESMTTVLEILSDKVNPLALGAVYRAREQSNDLAKRLLSSHHKDDEAKIERITTKLTQDLPTHNYLIGRAEAQNDIELDITIPSDEVDDLMWQLYQKYQSWLKLTTPFSPEIDLGEEHQKTIRYERASIESISKDRLKQHIFISDNRLIRVSMPPAAPTLPGVQPNPPGQIGQIVINTLFQGWLAHNDGEEIR